LIKKYKNNMFIQKGCIKLFKKM